MPVTVCLARLVIARGGILRLQLPHAFARTSSVGASRYMLKAVCVQTPRQSWPFLKLAYSNGEGLQDAALVDALKQVLSQALGPLQDGLSFLALDMFPQSVSSSSIRCGRCAR